jgi:NAD(P)-dependent dehydrogenase (short-subunit alcohol dehydrogenase family)
MKILVAGATGALGRRLVLLLTAAGHEVAGVTRSPAKADLLLSMGAEPVIADALDPAAVRDTVQREKPEIVVHELTSIKKFDLRNFDRGLAETNRLRTEGRIIWSPPRGRRECAASSRKALRVGLMREREAR